MRAKNFIKGAVTILYSKNSNKILVGEKKINTLYLSNSLGFPGALLQPGIDDRFNYRKTNLDQLSKNDIFNSNNYGRCIAAARGLYIELGILPIVENFPQKSKIETIKSYPMLELYKEKVENCPSTFADLFITKCLDIKSFIPFTHLQLNTKNNISYDIEVFVLPVEDMKVIDKISTNISKFHWVSGDTIPRLKEIFGKKQTNTLDNFSLSPIQEGNKEKDIIKTNHDDCHFQEVISRVNVAFDNTSDSLKYAQY
uniref:Nudix hydrolase domain-containing protein n=1 Tax=Strongyloides stercoralis TaxID=6248 RepID=A0A0K0ETB4_STRER